LRPAINVLKYRNDEVQRTDHLCKKV